MTVATAASKYGLKADNNNIILNSAGSNSNSDPTHSQKRHQSHWLKHDQQQQQQLTGNKQTADDHFLSSSSSRRGGDNTVASTVQVEARGRRNAAAAEDDPVVVVKDCGNKKTCSGTSSSRTKSSTSSTVTSSNGHRKSSSSSSSSSTMRPPNSASKPSTTRPMAGGAGAGLHPKIPKYASNRPDAHQKHLSRLEREFYKSYDSHEGFITAIVLGGFFAFVCLLVMYKTKCKPMWKNRRKRLTTTPATASVAELDDNVVGNGSLIPPAVVHQQFDSDNCQFDEEDDEFGFECIPLQSVCNEEDINDDIYFLDEFGNYVFPVSTPNTIQGSCSCPPSAEELNMSGLRRVSQVSSVSNAYTVKSLPGAYLYIPVVDATNNHHSPNLQSVPSLPSVKRALSDPQIHFSSPIGAHPIILTVNPSSAEAASEVRKRFTNRKHQPQRAMSMNQTGSQLAETTTGSHAHHPNGGITTYIEANNTNNNPKLTSTRPSPIKRDLNRGLTCQSIDINVIQPTPNISPSASLKSFDGASTTAMVGDSGTPVSPLAGPQNNNSNNSTNNNPNIEAIILSHNATSPTPSSSSSITAKSPRRVSFSEDEAAYHEATELEQANSPNLILTAELEKQPNIATNSKSTSSGSLNRGSLATSLRQMTVPMAATTHMSYLQVPGCQPQQLVAPHMTSEALAAQTSPQARRRRTTRLMKTGSFCSITSEGDGDIFNEDVCGGATGGSTSVSGYCGTSPGAASINSQPRGSTSSSGKYDPLSDYSEWQNEDTRSDISELFSKQTQQFSTSTPTVQQTTQQIQTSTTTTSGFHTPEVQIATGSSGTTTVHEVVAEHQPRQIQIQQQKEKTKKLSVTTSASLEDISYEVPTTTVLTPKVTHHAAMASDVNIDAEVSSISLSIGSEDNNQVITVPVTIEHPPPEMRLADTTTCIQIPQKVEAGCQQVTPASIAHHLGPSSMSSACMASSSTDYETSGISHPLEPEVVNKQLQTAGSEYSSSAEGAVGGAIALQTEVQTEAVSVEAMAANLEPGMKMVLVRDIGIQVSGDSPNLNLARKFKQGSPHHHHHHHHHHHSHQKASTTSKQDSLAEKFPAEILF